MRKDTVRNMETERWCLKAFLRIPKKGNNVKCSGGQGIRKPGFAGHAGYSVTGGTLPVTSPGHSKTLPGCFWVSTIRWTSASLCSCPHPCLQLPILSSISFPPPSLFFICGRWSYGCQILTPPHPNLPRDFSNLPTRGNVCLFSLSDFGLGGVTLTNKILAEMMQKQWLQMYLHDWIFSLVLLLLPREEHVPGVLQVLKEWDTYGADLK